ncbi:S-methyl-5-thioribose-1-phosphate isomerase [Streptomyces sp. NPDC002490]|uniref:S-methyl-5-thioribose-1-phosphate isomerase n=1 Tax=Streptomyces sp. NPDC002490 TaxID=3154416 RepID=UPI0033210CF4
MTTRSAPTDPGVGPEASTATGTEHRPGAAASLAWVDGAVVVIDQRALPHEIRWLRLRTVDELIDAIRSLAVRGAPAIGLAGALGVALSARLHTTDEGTTDLAAVRADAERIAAARPTAVNLAWAVSRVVERLPDGPDAVLHAALEAIGDDIATNRTAAVSAADLVTSLLPDRPLRVLTHCNTGRLATAAVGTALGTILELADRGRIAEVLVDETRPLLQGARLTAWELQEAGVAYRLCPDSAAAAAMSRGMVDCVLVGADRIAVNGDTANKIGTYALAVAAARHGIPFVVVAPESSWDPELPDGSGIVVEERGAEEVTTLAGVKVAPAGARVFNPAFDITPRELITALVTEERVVRPARGGAAAEAPGGSDAAAEHGTRAAEALADHCRVLYRRGWMPGTSGNLSVRLPGPGSRALITGSGLGKGALGPSDTVLVDADTGRAVRTAGGGPRPSAETSIHAAVYRCSDAQAVVHVHSPYATALARRVGARDRLTRLPLWDFELLKGLGLADATHTSLPVFPNWPDVPRIADDVAAHLADCPEPPPALLIADHGVTVWGRDLEQALNRLECVEAMCHLLLLDGGPDPARPAA